MNAHVTARLDNLQPHRNHQGTLDVVTSGLGNFFIWLVGSAMSDRERTERALQEARRDRHGLGIL